MSYQIKLSNGHQLTTIGETTVDTSTSLYLVGRNVRSYGELIADNFVHHLENFAFTSAPANPLIGQLWFDTTGHVLRLWNGTTWVMAGLPPITADGAVYTDTTIGVAQGLTMVNLGQNATPNIRRYRIDVQDGGDWVLQLLDDTQNVVAIPLSIVGREGFAHTVTPSDVDSSTKLVTTEWAKRNFVPAPLDNTTLTDGLGFTPVQQGAGVNQDPNKVKLGWHTTTSHLAFDVDNGGHTGDLATSNDLSAYALKSDLTIGLQGKGEQVGVIKAFAGVNAPTGYLLCAGQEVDRIAYGALFNVLGTMWGQGNGSTTFNVPDLRGRFLAGADDMGGAHANRLTAASNTAGTFATTGGDELLHVHGHPLTDSGHTHVMYDAGHTHPLTDPGHRHGIIDAGHSHGINDPGHDHRIFADNYWPFNVGNPADPGMGAKGSDYDGNYGWSDRQGTNIGIVAAGTGVDMYASGTGMTMTTVGTGVSVYAAASNVSIGVNGSGHSQNVPPVACINYIIYAGN